MVPSVGGILDYLNPRWESFQIVNTCTPYRHIYLLRLKDLYQGHTFQNFGYVFQGHTV